ncbi:MAG: histidine kinase dimerization/phosphoacceptor domain -containing protein [Crocinitomicaceae bacterium]
MRTLHLNITSFILLLLCLYPTGIKAQDYVQDKKVQDLLQKVDYYTGRDNHKALNLTLKLITWGEDRNDRHLLGIANIRRAIIYDISGDTKYAALYFQKGVEFLKKENDHAELAFAYNNFGIHYYNQKDWNEAMKYYNLAIKQFELAKDKESVVTTNINKAVIYKNLQNYDKALEIYRKSLEYYTIHLDSSMQLALNQNIASLYFEKGNIDSSFAYAQRAFAYRPQDMDAPTEAGIHILLSNCYNKKGDFSKGLYHGKIAFKIAEDHKIPESKMSASEALSYAYEGMGDSKQSMKYFKLFFELNDSLFYKNKSDEISEIRTRYQEKLSRDKAIMESRLEIEKLEQEYIVLQQDNFARKQREFYIVTVLILVGIMIITMIVFSWNKSKTNKELRNKNEIIESALSEKDILIKEVHHRVKNNLQLIVSMMELDSLNIQNPEARRKIRDTIGRIQSIGIIHQRLYEQENVTEIDSNIYFDKLFEEILRTSKENVEFNAHIENFFLDIDVGISFGLILNEMITNSIKYVNEKEIIINIDFSRKNDNLIMSYSDNGTVEGDEEIKGTGFGMKLIRIMSRKLKGELKVDKKKGIEYSLTIENYFK